MCSVPAASCWRSSRIGQNVLLSTRRRSAPPFDQTPLSHRRGLGPAAGCPRYQPSPWHKPPPPHPPTSIEPTLGRKTPDRGTPTLCVVAVRTPSGDRSIAVIHLAVHGRALSLSPAPVPGSCPVSHTVGDTFPAAALSEVNSPARTLMGIADELDRCGPCESRTTTVRSRWCRRTSRAQPAQPGTLACCLCHCSIHNGRPRAER